MRWAFYIRSVPFTRAILDGRASLGGSESACLGLARGLARRGQQVSLFLADVAPDACGPDGQGLLVFPVSSLDNDHLHHNWDVLVSLRMPELFAHKRWIANYRILWHQDLLNPDPRLGGKDLAANMVSTAWNVDRMAYVSEYHRKQWEGYAPDLAPLGWVTTNCYHPAHVPAPGTVAKDWRRIVHLSRPERALTPLLTMWPALKQRVPEATLRLCRYSSMYDADGWGRICAAYDAHVERINAEVGGIEWLGELGKDALYREIAEAAVMWYPGVADFAETSCIAAIEAQACGTPIVASRKGALPETAPHATLIPGDAMTPAYQQASLDAVVAALRGCRDGGGAYQQEVELGLAHAAHYTEDAVAGRWLEMVEDAFVRRSQQQPHRVLQALLHTDDHVAARQFAAWLPQDDPVVQTAIARCDRVIAGEDQTAEDYARFALPNAEVEGTADTRHTYIAECLTDRTHVLDVACGSGATAFVLARLVPDIHITGIDYSPELVERANAAAAAVGLADRVHFEQLEVYDYHAQCVSDAARAWLQAHAGQFDGLVVGEFLEHCANVPDLIDTLETALAPGATVVYTMPRGPFSEMQPQWKPIKRGHVHSFEVADLGEVFGGKTGLEIVSLNLGPSPQGHPLAHWLVRYQVAPGRRAGRRDLARVALTTRPRPTLSVGIIAKNAAADLLRCLQSVRDIADEVVVGDTGSTDETVKIAESMDCRVLHLPDVYDHPDGFAGVRNAVLAACTGDWFLWIDTDETLEGGRALRRYLETALFNGFALHQNHLMLDTPNTHDTPVRVFRRLPSIQFYGCVHEQPQMGDCNGDVIPALELHDVQIAHIGYRTELIRRQKANRNFPLILRNRKQFPDRILNGPIEIREAVLRGNDEAIDNGLSAEARRLYGWAVLEFESRFADPANKYHAIARPFYEQALAQLSDTWEFELAFAGQPQKLNGRSARPRRFKVRRPEDVEAMLRHEAAQAVASMRPITLHTDPFEEATS